MLYRPLELIVEVRNAKERFDESPNRYFVEFVAIEPKSKNYQIIHFVLDGVTQDWRKFVVVGTKWRIRNDDDTFDSERSIGFSFWSISELHPIHVE